MAADETEAVDRIIWVGGRRTRGGFLGFIRDEPERDWRERLTQEMNEACDEMASQGLRLASIVPVTRSRELHGGWTEGAWLHFARAD
jgi:phosphoenolpyruvate carboxylase